MKVKVRDIQTAMAKNAVFSAMMGTKFAIEVAETLKDPKWEGIPQKEKEIEIEVYYNGLKGPADLINTFLQDQHNMMRQKFEEKYSDIEAEIKRRVDKQVDEAIQAKKQEVFDRIEKVKEKLDSLESEVWCI